MASEEAQNAMALMRVEKKAAPVLPLNEARAGWIEECALEPLPDETIIQALTIGGVVCEKITNSPVATEKIFLLLHGGCYDAGNCITHRKLAAHISAAVERPVIVPDYRLAPEHPFPAAIEDARAVYDALLADGLSARQIVIGGDSAGGGLSLALLLNLREDGVDMPPGTVLLSPWTDIVCAGASYETNREADPGMVPERLRARGLHYLGSSDPNDPMISPIKADLDGLPPMLVHVGAAEIMLDDSAVFVERAKAAGVKVHLEIWEDMWHVWHNYAPEVPEAVEAVRRIGSFVRDL